MSTQNFQIGQSVRTLAPQSPQMIVLKVGSSVTRADFLCEPADEVICGWWDSRLWRMDSFPRSVLAFVEQESAEQEPKLEFKNRPLCDVGLPRLTVRALELASIKTVDDLLKRTERDLIRLPRFGFTSLLHVREALHASGHTLPGKRVPVPADSVRMFGMQRAKDAATVARLNASKL